MTSNKPAATFDKAPRVFGFSLSYFFNKRLRRLLKSAGIIPVLGWPQSNDQVLIWGRAGTATRGQRIANFAGIRTLTVEDGFLRSVKTGREGEQSLSLIVDGTGIYFDTAEPNDLLSVLMHCPKLSAEEITEARNGISFLKQNHLSKYNNFDLEFQTQPENYVLVVDQTFGDASISGANANAETFALMLKTALAEHSDATILVKTHPETRAGKRRGYFGDSPDARVELCDSAVSPWRLMEGAKAVYCVSSQMGMEAIFAGHKPIVFGNAFYTGWGLTDDRNPKTVLKRILTTEQLFQCSLIKYCRWYDPYFDRATNFQSVAQILATKAQSTRERQKPQVFVGMRLWKRGFLKRYFSGTPKAPKFIDDVNKAIATAKIDNADVLVWSGKETTELSEGCAKENLRLVRVEDGFLRSSGLGAQLIQPVSLAFDDLGIYYDPTRESRLEQLIASSQDLPETELARAENIRQEMISLGLSKYNLKSAKTYKFTQDKDIVLVPGQVEDDQSILKGASTVSTNLELVRSTRTLFPDSYIVYKPHPDVVAGLRNGGEEFDEISKIADEVITDTSITDLIDEVDRVSTITSQTGFEALLRGKEVTCFGAPFYAGWGLTDDRGWVPERRSARPSLQGLIHAALISYPRYWDPVTGDPCPIEVVLERFRRGEVRGDGRRAIRWLAKVQGVFASYAYLWR